MEEWESFLETPIASSTQECFLPLLQTLCHQTLQPHNEESEAPQRTEMRIVASQVCTHKLIPKIRISHPNTLTGPIITL